MMHDVKFTFGNCIFTCILIIFNLEYYKLGVLKCRYQKV